MLDHTSICEQPCTELVLKCYKELIVLLKTMTHYYNQSPVSNLIMSTQPIIRSLGTSQYIWRLAVHVQYIDLQRTTSPLGSEVQCHR